MARLSATCEPSPEIAPTYTASIMAARVYGAAVVAEQPHICALGYRYHGAHTLAGFELRAEHAPVRAFYILTGPDGARTVLECSARTGAPSAAWPAPVWSMGPEFCAWIQRAVASDLFRRTGRKSLK